MFFTLYFILRLCFISYINSSLANSGPSETFYYGQESEQTTVANECNLSSKYGSFKEFIKLFGTADIKPLHKGAYQLKSNLNLTTYKQLKCLTLNEAESLTQEQLLNRLTAPCRYDRLESPVSNLKTQHPVDVYVRALIYDIKNKAQSTFHFQVRGLMQLRYNDPRLAYGDFVTHKKQPIISEVDLENKIWVPKICIANQYDSSILGPNEKKKLISLSSDGSVLVSFMIEATYNCMVKQKTFPFDENKCSIFLKSYKYNSSQLLLFWEQNTPIWFDPKMMLSQYVLTNSWSNESIFAADIIDEGYGLSPGNYSALSFTIHLTREVDLYMMDYFFPSMMIVAISWVSFWLQADQTPARTTLGTSTMLSFITLTSSQGKNLTKVNSINASEVWFLGCTFFIFGSLVEFAFVNNIWRRSKNLELKNINRKHVFKSALTPNTNSQKIGKRYRSIACKRRYKHMDKLEDPTIIYVTKEVKTKHDIESKCVSKSHIGELQLFTIKLSDNSSLSNMTPHDIALWIDRKARFVFPLAFIIYNGIFWTFLYCF